MAWVALVASTLVSAAGASQAAQAQADAAEYNASVTRMKAEADEARQRREADRKMGSIRSGISKSGVTTEGTPLLVLAESAELAELDAQNIRWTGETSAQLYEAEAEGARDSIPYSVGASLLSGGAQAYEAYNA